MCLLGSLLALTLIFLWAFIIVPQGQKNLYNLRWIMLFNFHALYILSIVFQKPFKVKLDIPSSWCAINKMILTMKNALESVWRGVKSYRAWWQYGWCYTHGWGWFQFTFDLLFWKDKDTHNSSNSIGSKFFFGGCNGSCRNYCTQCHT